MSVVNAQLDSLTFPSIINFQPLTINEGLVFSICALANNSESLTSSPIDFYGNGTINFQDIVYFVEAYIQYNQFGIYNSACDLNHDGAINFADLLLFVQDYVAYAQSLATNSG